MATARFLLFSQDMKSISKTLTRSILVSLFIAVGAGRALANDPNTSGWYDSNHVFHAYIANLHPIQGNSPGIPESRLADTPAAL